MAAFQLTKGKPKLISRPTMPCTGSSVFVPGGCSLHPVKNRSGSFVRGAHAKLLLPKTLFLAQKSKCNTSFFVTGLWLNSAKQRKIGEN